MTGIQIDSIVEDRLPGKEEAWLVFSACVFPIHAWVTIVFLYNLPSLILKANIWQIFGVLAYALVFALFESLLLFVFLVLLGAVLPRRLFRERFALLGTLLALIIPAFTLLLNTHFMQESTWAWIPVLSLAGAGIFVSLRYPENSSRQHALAGRFTLIASLYLIFDLLALVILVVMVILQ
jgi:hypothetical protein